MTFTWNDKNISTLTRMWEKGERAEDIAAKIGHTRNAVIGKAHRLGLEPHPMPKARGIYAPRPSLRKLSPEQVAEMRNSKQPYKFARDLGVCLGSVRPILKRRIYRDVKESA